MDARPVPVALAQFVAMIRQDAPTAQTTTVLQSLDAWVPYDRGLQLILDGNILLTPQDRPTYFYLFARPTPYGQAGPVARASPWQPNEAGGRGSNPHRQRWWRARMCPQDRGRGDMDARQRPPDFVGR
jgi:hypothetical protein